MKEFKLFAPTCYIEANGQNEQQFSREDFGEPTVPVLIHETDVVRIVLGSHDFQDDGVPDLQIERRPNGWAVFIHPNAGDPCGCIFILDDGRSYVVPERYPPCIQFIDSPDEIPELDAPVADAHHVRISPYSAQPETGEGTRQQVNQFPHHGRR